MLKRRRGILLSAVLLGAMAPFQAQAISFDIRDDTDRYLDAIGIFDSTYWECLLSGGCDLDDAVAGGAAYVGGWDLNTMSILGYEDPLFQALLGGTLPDPPRDQQNVINSLSLVVRVKDDDDSLWDFGERASVVVGTDLLYCDWDLEVDGDTLTCNFPTSALSPYADWQNLAVFGVVAYVNDIKIDYVRAFGDYTPVTVPTVPEPGTLALLGLGLAGLGLSRRRKA